MADRPACALNAERLFASFDGSPDPPALSGLCLDLLEQQKDFWPDLRSGYAALDSVRLREMAVRGATVRLQFNPGRIVSSAAAVDPESISRRKCFLCVRNLPESQWGILYRQTYLILCNPAPIFPRHYTISHLRHLPQVLENHIDEFLSLAGDFGPGFSLFYNGPRCGASAPDHLHFQAAPWGIMPVEKEIEEVWSGRGRTGGEEASMDLFPNTGRRIMVLEGKNRDAVSVMLRKTVLVMKKVLSIDDEPMMNLLCAYNGARWRVLIFPRRKHRPDAYDRKDGDRLLISPGTVDMGGLVITPVEKDFDRIKADEIESILDEVSLDKETVDKVIAAL